MYSDGKISGEPAPQESGNNSNADDENSLEEWVRQR